MIGSLALRVVAYGLIALAAWRWLEGQTGLAIALAVAGFLVLTLGGRRPPLADPSELRPIELSDERLAEVLDLLDAGRRIEAVKLVRDATGAGLKASKEFVDILARK